MSTRAESVKIIRYQIIFLMVLALGLCAFFTWRDWQEGRATVAAQRSVSLNVQASQLVLLDEAGPGASLMARLPARLTPFFFQKIPVNSADLELLCTIPGIGPQTAMAILRKRDERGGLRSVEDLLAIHGIGPKKAASFEEQLTFSE